MASRSSWGEASAQREHHSLTLIVPINICEAFLLLQSSSPKGFFYFLIVSHPGQLNFLTQQLHWISSHYLRLSCHSFLVQPLYMVWRMAPPYHTDNIPVPISPQHLLTSSFLSTLSHCPQKAHPTGQDLFLYNAQATLNRTWLGNCRLTTDSTRMRRQT